MVKPADPTKAGPTIVAKPEDNSAASTTGGGGSGIPAQTGPTKAANKPAKKVKPPVKPAVTLDCWSCAALKTSKICNYGGR